MFPIERHQQILTILKKKKSVTVNQLSHQLYIGEATIRRDLEKLEKKNLLKRTYGGAVLLEGLDQEIPLSVRENENIRQKEIIGRLAAGLVQNSDTIIIDSSSTTLRMVPYLKGKEKLTAITNGAKTSIELAELLHIKVYCTGGVLRENSLSFIGEPARRCMENFFVDTVFFSCRGLSLEQGLTDSNEEEAELRKIMIKNSRKAVLLCDSSKFNQTSFCKICSLHDINYVITDQKPSDDWLNFFSEKKVDFLYPLSSDPY